MFRILHDQRNCLLMQRKAETRVCGQRVYHDMKASGREYTYGGLPTQNMALLQVICVIPSSTWSTQHRLFSFTSIRSRCLHFAFSCGSLPSYLSILAASRMWSWSIAYFAFSSSLYRKLLVSLSCRFRSFSCLTKQWRHLGFWVSMACYGMQDHKRC